MHTPTANFALSAARKIEARGDAFVPNYLDMLTGGSMKPEDLTALVDAISPTQDSGLLARHR